MGDRRHERAFSMNDNIRSASTLSLRVPFNAPHRRKQPTELEKARAETERIREEAAAAHEAAAEARTRMQKSARDAKFRLRATAVIMMTAALVKLGWEAAHAPDPAPMPLVAQTLPPAGVASASKSRQTSDNSASTDASPGAKALERLRTAFHAFPEEDQMDLVREINERYPGPGVACPLVWTDGVPALYVGDPKGKAPPSMVNALNRCALEAEKLRIERDAAFK